MAMQLSCVTALIVVTKSGLPYVWLNMTKYDWMSSSNKADSKSLLAKFLYCYFSAWILEKPISEDRSESSISALNQNIMTTSTYCTLSCT